MIRVSVIVAAYNVSPYLSRCLDSLLVQTESSIEVLIVNDGSTDETPLLADRYASKDARVTVIHQENRGVSAARNAGLSAATGTYVCFIDGDDWAEPVMVETMASWCESTGAQVAIAGAYVDFHDETDGLKHSVLRSLPRYDIWRGQRIPAEVIDETLINLLGYPWNKMYRRDWLVALDEWFEEGLNLFEDIDFNCRVLSEAEYVLLVPQAFVHYIQRPRPSLGDFRETNFLVLCSRAIKSVDFLLREWGAEDEVRKAREASASAIALWSGLDAAARTPRARQMLKQIVCFPEVEELFVMAATTRSGGWRGAWATFTIGRGWYRTALLPALAIRTFKGSPQLKPESRRRRLPWAAPKETMNQPLRTATMIQKIKSMIPERYKGPILAELKPNSYPDLEAWKGRKKVVVTLAGFYQNLGDMALTYAQKRFVEKVLPDYEVLLFPSTHTYSRMKALKRIVGPEDIVTTMQ